MAKTTHDIEHSPELRQTQTIKGPNVLFRKSLEKQLGKLNKKAAFHTTKANEYLYAADSIQSAIKTLAHQTPSLFDNV